MNIGIIGCGNICNTYIREIKRLYADLLTIKTVADKIPENAKQMAERYDIENYQTVDEILADPEIGLIINLTIPAAHKEINLRILEAGKHVFCEKPIAFTVADAQEIEALAKEKHLYIGAAPDTFLTAPVQSCKKMIQDGWIGDVKYATANMLCPGHESWHPSPEFYYKQGGGPLYDMGGYYLTVLIDLFGPIEEVFAYSGKAFPQRTIMSQPLAGKVIDVDIPTHFTALLKTVSGVIIDMNMSFDVWYTTKPKLEVYGTDGTLTMPDPNLSDGKPILYRKEQQLRKCYGLEPETEGTAIPLLMQSVSGYTRGTGVADMVNAIHAGTEPRANMSLAIHVLEIMEGIIKSSEEGVPVSMTTRV